jgi:hypothetical protein
MSSAKSSTSPAAYIHPDDPAGRLEPDQPLLVDGLDWSWAFVWFKDVPGHSGYRVGVDGNVWSCLEHAGPGKYVMSDRWHRLKPRPHYRSGHLWAKLGHHDQRPVHQLVLEAFVGPCPPGLECRHLDGDPTNNELWNLCWGTRTENMEDMVRHGRAGKVKGEANGRAVLSEADVREAVAMHKAGKSISLIARWFGVSRRTIGQILNGELWNHVTGLPRPAAKPTVGGVVLKVATANL